MPGAWLWKGRSSFFPTGAECADVRFHYFVALGAENGSDGVFDLGGLDVDKGWGRAKEHKVGASGSCHLFGEFVHIESHHVGAIAQFVHHGFHLGIIVDVDKDLHIRFKGFIDKILYNKFNGQTIVAIVDYKTGNPNLNINNSIYGLEMQLPIYIYLIKNEIKDVKIGGFYLQKILNNITDKEKKLDSLKLQGYTNSDLDIIDKVDSSFNDSKIIKSLRTSSKGFYAYSKVINDEEIDTLNKIVESKIKESSINILDSKFDINPKEMNNEVIGCKYCKYKDICFMKPKDTITLKEIKNIFEEVE